MIYGVGIAGIITIGPNGSLIALMTIHFLAINGLAATIIDLNIAGTTGVEQGRRGLVAGLIITAQQIGAAVGVGMASAVVSTALLIAGNSPATRMVSYRYAIVVSECMELLSIFLYWISMRYLVKHRGLEGTNPS